MEELNLLNDISVLKKISQRVEKLIKMICKTSLYIKKGIYR